MPINFLETDLYIPFDYAILTISYEPSIAVKSLYPNLNNNSPIIPVPQPISKILTYLSKFFSIYLVIS